MEKHWEAEDWHKFYAEHLDLDPAKFTTNELVRLYDLHHYRLDLCGDNERARAILDAGIKSPLEAPNDPVGGDGRTFQSEGYLIEYGRDENGDVFQPGSLGPECMDLFMKNPVVTMEFDPTKIIGKVTGYRIDEKGVMVDIAAKAPAGSDVKYIKTFVPALGGVLNNRSGDFTVVQRVDQVGLIRPENKVKRRD